MKKIPFGIEAKTEGTRAVIHITGTIGWDTDCEDFRKTVVGMTKDGVNDIHLYLHGPGGSCFDAEEIVNILSSSGATITGEGGALVASAYTRIAMICDSFTMPENGMFMIHKPSGGAYGTSDEISCVLKLLKDMEAQYLETYKAKATDIEALESRWASGDWWMTASEAKAHGFISSVKEQTKIGKGTTAMISACGCPESKLPTININENQEKEMDLKSTAKALNLPETASEAEVNAAIAKAAQSAKDLAELQVSILEKEKAEKAKSIKAMLDAAILDKRITADARANWEQMLNANYEVASELLGKLVGVQKIQTKATGTSSASAAKGKVTYMGKTFEELQDENVEALADLHANDMQTYDELYQDYLKRNKL